MLDSPSAGNRRPRLRRDLYDWLKVLVPLAAAAIYLLIELIRHFN